MWDMRRLVGTFTRDASGRRPVFGGSETFQTDPHWRDCLLFYEYFTATTVAEWAPATRRAGRASLVF
jgi:hypothetical protein